MLLSSEAQGRHQGQQNLAKSLLIQASLVGGDWSGRSSGQDQGAECEAGRVCWRLLKGQSSLLAVDTLHFSKFIQRTPSLRV